MAFTATREVSSIMGKHTANYVVMVRPTFASPEVLLGFPYRDRDTAEAEAEHLFRHSSNYSVRVATINVATGNEIPTVQTATAERVGHMLGSTIVFPDGRTRTLRSCKFGSDSVRFVYTEGPSDGYGRNTEIDFIPTADYNDHAPLS